MREDEFDRCVTDLKLRAARERIRERDERCDARRVLEWMPPEKKSLDRILDLRRVGGVTGSSVRAAWPSSSSIRGLFALLIRTVGPPDQSRRDSCRSPTDPAE